MAQKAQIIEIPGNSFANFAPFCGHPSPSDPVRSCLCTVDAPPLCAEKQPVNSQTHTVIAIDGPAASGKSTVARRVAAALGFVYVNSGAMYRAFTRHALDRGIDCSDRSAVVSLLNETFFTAGERDGAGTIAVNGVELEDDAIHGEAINANVSQIAAIPEVRERLVAEQRAYASKSDVVMEGRDIGTVVFPETPHKFYIDASVEVRERRRREQGFEDRVAERDRADSSRETAPLSVAEDATVIDSSEKGIEEVVGVVLDRIRAGQGQA